MELSPQKQFILENSNDRTVVIASAASGKTALLTEKVRQLIRSGQDLSRMAVITFTNMAAGELRKRLDKDDKPGLFIGTIHSLANYFLMSSGIQTSKVIENENFDELFELVQEHPECVKPMDWIILDEAQDSSYIQFEFLFEMIAPEHFFVVGDPKQSIYQWNKGDPRLLKNLAREFGVETFDLNENYRNGANILSYAKRITRRAGNEDHSICMTDWNSTILESDFNPKKFVDLIQSNPPYKEWAILTRTNAEANEMAIVLSRANIPFDTFKQGDLTNEQLGTKMKQNTVKILTIHSAKGLEWDNVIVIGTRFNANEEINVCYVAATRARKFLIWSKGISKKARITKW